MFCKSITIYFISLNFKLQSPNKNFFTFSFWQWFLVQNIFRYVVWYTSIHNIVFIVMYAFGALYANICTSFYASGKAAKTFWLISNYFTFTGTCFILSCYEFSRKPIRVATVFKGVALGLDNLNKINLVFDLVHLSKFIIVIVLKHLFR